MKLEAVREFARGKQKFAINLPPRLTVVRNE